MCRLLRYLTTTYIYIYTHYIYNTNYYYMNLMYLSMYLASAEIAVSGPATWLLRPSPSGTAAAATDGIV